MPLLNLIILLLLIVPFGIALHNFFRFARMRAGDRPAREIAVSILVPARNEERGIEECVRSLLAQEYARYEVIVLDDSSEDRTPEILRSIVDPRLRLLEGSPLPEGWGGKNWACRQLAAEATGELLVFTDADTVHRAGSVASIVAFGERSGCCFFSGVPRQNMIGFWERVLVPMAPFLYFAFLPNEWITRRSDPKFSATNGQLLCCTRDAYTRIGGHDAVRGSVLEDVELGRAAKRAGLRTALATAVETVDCRMYRSPAEIVEGFSKNLYPGLGAGPLGLIFFVVFMILLFVYPLVALVVAMIRGDWSAGGFVLPLLSLLVGGAIRLMLAIRLAMPLDQIFHQPLGALAAAAIAINSARLHRSPGGPVWKGRRTG